MNRIKTIILLLNFIILARGSSAFAQLTSKEISDGFFALYAKNPDKAVEYAFSTNFWMTKKPEVVTNVKSQLKSLITQLGNYVGYDVITDNSITPNFKSVKYLVKYEREPIQFTFLFYKPKDKWMVLNFSYNEDMTKEIEEASKTK